MLSKFLNRADICVGLQLPADHPSTQLSPPPTAEAEGPPLSTGREIGGCQPEFAYVGGGGGCGRTAGARHMPAPMPGGGRLGEGCPGLIGGWRLRCAAAPVKEAEDAAPIMKSTLFIES